MLILFQCLQGIPKLNTILRSPNFTCIVSIFYAVNQLHESQRKQSLGFKERNDSSKTAVYKKCIPVLVDMWMHGCRSVQFFIYFGKHVYPHGEQIFV